MRGSRLKWLASALCGVTGAYPCIWILAGKAGWWGVLSSSKRLGQAVHIVAEEILEAREGKSPCQGTMEAYAFAIVTLAKVVISGMAQPRFKRWRGRPHLLMGGAARTHTCCHAHLKCPFTHLYSRPLCLQPFSLFSFKLLTSQPGYSPLPMSSYKLSPWATFLSI